jgi:hypothetical protein
MCPLLRYSEVPLSIRLPLKGLLDSHEIGSTSFLVLTSGGLVRCYVFSGVGCHYHPKNLSSQHVSQRQTGNNFGFG